jgi:hypothetical protein
MTILIWQAPMNYYSQGDEAAFFSQLNSIPEVISVVGMGHELHINFSNNLVSDTSIQELIAIYSRYSGNMKELALFATPENVSWFKNKEAYWYARIFS